MIGVAGQPSTEAVLAQGGGSQNFLLPNGTFFFELILFVVVFFLLAKFVVPPIRKAMEDRAERVRQTQRDREEADEQYRAAENKHAEVLAEARNEASSIRDEARATAREQAAEQRAQAEREISEVRERGERELAEQRSRAEGDLQEKLPDLSRTLAERILGRSLSDDGSARSTTESYVRSLNSSESSDSSARTRRRPRRIRVDHGRRRLVGVHGHGDEGGLMHSASQSALDHAEDQLEQIVSDESTGSAEHLAQVSQELYAVADVLGKHIDLRRHLVDPTGSASLRRSLVENLFSDKVDATTAQLLTTLVETRLTSPTDLVEAVELLGRTAALASAEKDGTLSDTEDDLFRFGRILQREPQLRTSAGGLLGPGRQEAGAARPGGRGEGHADRVPAARAGGTPPLLEGSRPRGRASGGRRGGAPGPVDRARRGADRPVRRAGGAAGGRAVTSLRALDLGAVRRRPGHPGWPGRAGRR